MVNHKIKKNTFFYKKRNKFLGNKDIQILVKDQYL